MDSYQKASSAQIAGYEAPRDYPDQTYHYAHSYGNSQSTSFSQQNVESYPTVISMLPTSGPTGTRVVIKVNSPYLLSAEYIVIAVGNMQCHCELSRSPDDPANVYTISIDMPQMAANTTAQVSLVITASNSAELARLPCGSFTTTGSISNASVDKDSKSVSPHTTTVKPTIPDVNPTTAYDCAPIHPSAGMAYTAPSYTSTGATDMIAYRNGSFGDTSSYNRGPPAPALRPPMNSWPQYNQPIDSTRPMMRSSISTMGMTSTGVPNIQPRLVRTSTLQAGMNGMGNGYNYGYTQRIDLKLMSSLNEMALHWSTDEWSNKRRIVRFKRNLVGTTIQVSFQPVTANERPPQGLCVSCIWWEEHQACYITSVDTIALLEQLLVTPNRFSVEEKNRIRRNLEGFKPATVGKAKSETEEFFKVIMGFSNPKPRNIEKDVKVFPWKVLESALKKIVNKYSLNPGSDSPPTHSSSISSSQMVPSLGAYQSVSSPSAPATDGVNAAYTVHATHATNPENMASPRSMNNNSAWGNYTATTAPPRTISPSFRTAQSAGLQSIPPVAALDTRPMAGVAAAGPYVSSLQDPLHHGQQRWDAGHAAGSHYDAGVAQYGAQQHQVYAGAGYADAAGHR